MWIARPWVLTLIGCSLVTTLCAQFKTGPLQDMVNAELAFIRMAEEVDTRTAFLCFLSDSAVTNSPEGPVIGKERILAQPINQSWLRWRIAFCDIAASGDLGYTTGPWEYLPSRSSERAVAWGVFHSIWRKDVDNVWRNILDIGVRQPETDLDVTAECSAIATQVGRKKKKEVPGSAVLSRLEMEFIDALRERGQAAYTSYASSELRIAREGKASAVTASERQSFIRERTSYSTYHQIDCGMSGAGDFGYVYGRAEAVGPERTPPATYVRIWKKEPAGWRLILDVLAPAG